MMFTPKTIDEPATLRLALPKGRMHRGVIELLARAGIEVRASERGYRPSIALPGFEAKILKPQNIIEMLQTGSRDIGFAGADWVREMGADVVELLDTELDPVRLVAAAPRGLLDGGELPARPLRVASEYERLTREWIRDQNMEARFVRSFGATEVFPPEDADCIVDNTATGTTLRANGLIVVDELMRSSTRLYASPAALADPVRRDAIERLVLVLASVIEARSRVMVEVNVAADRLEAVCAALPCMRKPTLSTLHGEDAYAVKAAVPRAELALVIPELKARGGTEIVVTALSQIVP